MKILYLYNKDNWALHNVGKIWFSDLSKEFDISMENYHNINNPLEYFKQYDYVWFGYIYMYMKFNYDIEKSIVTVHDPMELFSQTIEWKQSKPIKENTLVLQKLKYVNTISSELFNIITKYNKSVYLINTIPEIISINKESVTNSELKVLSIANDYPRKNFDLLEQIKNFCIENGIPFLLKKGDEINLLKDYINMIDGYSVYVCTSFQEGGPLPAMEAMLRGLVVLTTPVGQVQEIIDDDINGFICKSFSDFKEKLLFFKNNPDTFLEIRKRSLDNFQNKRNGAIISKQISNFLISLK